MTLSQKLLPFYLTIALVSLSSFGQITWFTKACKTGTCKVDFPSDKIVEKVDIHTNKTIFSYKARYKKQDLLFSSTIYNKNSRSVFENPAQQILDVEMRKKKAKLIEVTQNKKVNNLTVNSVRYEIGDEIEGILDILVIDNYVYKLEFSAPKGKLDEELANAFFNRFKVKANR